MTTMDHLDQLTILALVRSSPSANPEEFSRSHIIGVPVHKQHGPHWILTEMYIFVNVTNSHAFCSQSKYFHRLFILSGAGMIGILRSLMRLSNKASKNLVSAV